MHCKLHGPNSAKCGATDHVLFVTLVCMQKLQALRVHLREKFANLQPQVENSDEVKVAFRLPDSTKIEFSVSSSQPTQVRDVTYEI